MRSMFWVEKTISPADLAYAFIDPSALHSQPFPPSEQQSRERGQTL